MSKLIVHKYGSSVLADESRLEAVVDSIYISLRAGYRVIVVVSAMGDTTDTLMFSSRSHPSCTWPLTCSTGQRALRPSLWQLPPLTSSVGSRQQLTRRQDGSGRRNWFQQAGKSTVPSLNKAAAMESADRDMTR